MSSKLLELIRTFPDTPGVYLMRDRTGTVIYVGKATSLRHRVTSYFQKAHDSRIAQLVREIATIETIPTVTALEALLKEAELIKRLMPRYNVRIKDDKSYLYVKIHKARLPRLQTGKTRAALKIGSNAWLDRYYPLVELVRAREVELQRDTSAWYFGPYLSGFLLRKALDAIRRVFAFRMLGGYADRPNLYFYGKQYKAPWLGGATPAEYARDLQRLREFLRGNRVDLVRAITKEMQAAAHNLLFERAAALRIQLDAFEHLKDIALIQEADEVEGQAIRIEGYDISNLNNEGIVGSMVVFVGEQPARDQYRRFRMRKFSQNDIGALVDMVTRRFINHKKDWPLPDVLVIDGGIAHLTAVKRVLVENNLLSPIVAVAKGPQRNRLDLLFDGPRLLDDLNLIRAIRDEAHRFAITFQRSLRVKKVQESALDAIPGIGAHRKNALLRKFGSVKRIQDATLQEIMTTKGMSSAAARSLMEYL
jgi:excinuclease ABC subunit C